MQASLRPLRGTALVRLRGTLRWDGRQALCPTTSSPLRLFSTAANDSGADSGGVQDGPEAPDKRPSQGKAHNFSRFVKTRPHSFSKFDKVPFGIRLADARWREFVSRLGGLENVRLSSFKDRVKVIRVMCDSKRNFTPNADKRLAGALSRLHVASQKKGAGGSPAGFIEEHDLALRTVATYKPDEALKWLRFRIDANRAVSPNMFTAAIQGFMRSDRRARLKDQKDPKDFFGKNYWGFEFRDYFSTRQSLWRLEAISSALDILLEKGPEHPALAEIAASGPGPELWTPLVSCMMDEPNFNYVRLTRFHKNVMQGSTDPKVVKIMLEWAKHGDLNPKNALLFSQDIAKIIGSREYCERVDANPNVILANAENAMSYLAYYTRRAKADPKTAPRRVETALWLHLGIVRNKPLQRAVAEGDKYDSVLDTRRRAADTSEANQTGLEDENAQPPAWDDPAENSDFANYTPKLLVKLVCAFGHVQPPKVLKDQTRNLYRTAATLILSDPEMEIDTDLATELFKALASNPGPVQHHILETFSWLSQNPNIDDRDPDLLLACLDLCKGSASNLGVRFNLAYGSYHNAEQLASLELEIRNVVEYGSSVAGWAADAACSKENAVLFASRDRDAYLMHVRLAHIELLHLAGSWDAASMVIKNAPKEIWSKTRLYNSMLAFHARFSGDFEAAKMILERAFSRNIDFDTETLTNAVACLLGEHDILYLGVDGDEAGAPASVVEEAVDLLVTLCNRSRTAPSRAIVQRLCYSCKRLELPKSERKLRRLAYKYKVTYYDFFSGQELGSSPRGAQPSRIQARKQARKRDAPDQT